MGLGLGLELGLGLGFRFGLGLGLAAGRQHAPLVCSVGIAQVDCAVTHVRRGVAELVPG